MPNESGTDQPQFSFGIIADCQYANAESWPEATSLNPDAPVPEIREFRASPAKLQAAVDQFNDRDLAFVAHLGDLIDRSPDDLADLVPILKTSTAPILQVIGNHDIQSFRGDLPANLKAFGLTDSYYAHQVDDVRFLVLDTNQEGALDQVPGSPEWERQRRRLDGLREAGQVNAQTWNGAVGRTQLQWLEDQLNDAQQVGHRVIMMAHQPLLPSEQHCVLNAGEILALIERFPSAVAYLNGHRHSGDLVEQNGRPYLTFKAMVNTEQNTFAICHVHHDHLEIEPFGRELPRTLRLGAHPRSAP